MITESLPCDRGIPNNVLSRGYHSFQANNLGVVVCTLCGDLPARSVTMPTSVKAPVDPGQLYFDHMRQMWPDDKKLMRAVDSAEVDYMARQARSDIRQRSDGENPTFAGNA